MSTKAFNTCRAHCASQATRPIAVLTHIFSRDLASEEKLFDNEWSQASSTYRSRSAIGASDRQAQSSRRGQPDMCKPATPCTAYRYQRYLVVSGVLPACHSSSCRGVILSYLSIVPRSGGAFPHARSCRPHHHQIRHLTHHPVGNRQRTQPFSPQTDAFSAQPTNSLTVQHRSTASQTV
jgi:hypothetical protein